MGDYRRDSSSLRSLREARRTSSLLFGLTTARPAESWPRYWSRLSPSRIRGTTFLGRMYPTIPHTVFSPTRKERRKRQCRYQPDRAGSIVNLNDETRRYLLPRTIGRQKVPLLNL